LHPFKFALSDICKKTVACERDIRIISKEAILEEIKNEMGEEIYNNFNQEYFDKLICCHTPSNQTPFDIDEFDKIFCISLFEHINKKERIEILQEFYRILKAKGMVVLTFDCPAIDILELKEMAISVGFKVLGNTDYKIPENVVKGEIYSPDLICGRMVLQKQYL
jgi:SAM-dependent methyltransferase